MQTGTLFRGPSEEDKRRLPLQWLIIIPLLVVAAAGGWWYLSRHPPIATKPGETPYVPPERVIRAGHPDFDWYGKYFRIMDTNAKIIFNFAGDRNIVVFGVFDNRGERAVEAAEIKITFFDPDGQVIRERIAAPLRPETGLKRPLDSLTRRQFSVRFSNMPMNLQVGRLEVVLTGIAFAPRS